MKFASNPLYSKFLKKEYGSTQEQRKQQLGEKADITFGVVAGVGILSAIDQEIERYPTRCSPFRQGDVPDIITQFILNEVSKT